MAQLEKRGGIIAEIVQGLTNYLSKPSKAPKWIMPGGRCAVKVQHVQRRLP